MIKQIKSTVIRKKAKLILDKYSLSERIISNVTDSYGNKNEIAYKIRCNILPYMIDNMFNQYFNENFWTVFNGFLYSLFTNEVNFINYVQKSNLTFMNNININVQISNKTIFVTNNGYKTIEALKPGDIIRKIAGYSAK